VRPGFVAFVLTGVAVAGIAASSAFNEGVGGGRVLTVQLVGDSVGVLSVAGHGASACLVSEDGTTGQLAVTLSGAIPAAGCTGHGAGTGVNAGDSAASRYARYYLHDLLLVTNKGQKAATVWFNVSASPSTLTVLVAANNASGTMGVADYSSTGTSVPYLAVGSSTYVGLAVNTTAAEGSSLYGWLNVSARATP
jgi:hypothetical protein